MDYSALSALGLGQREQAVYAALLESGPCTIGPIARRSGLRATKVYDVIDRLVAKGLAGFTIKSKTHIFSAAPASRLRELAERQAEGLESAIASLEKVSAGAGEAQVAVVHEGHEAFTALFDRISGEIRPDGEYLAFAFSDEYARGSTAPILFKKFHRRLADKGVTDHVIADPAHRKELRGVYADNPNIKIRFSKTKTPVGVSIVNGRVIQLTWGRRPTAIEITSPQVFTRYRAFFLDAWKSSR